MAVETLVYILRWFVSLFKPIVDTKKTSVDHCGVDSGSIRQKFPLTSWVNIHDAPIV